MSRGKTWPFEEGWPDKPDTIEEGSAADAEWTRICTTLAARNQLSPAWGSMIGLAAGIFETMQQLDAEMTRHGRTEEMAESHAACVAQYREVCRDLLVEPHTSATVRPSRQNGGM